MEIIDFFHLPHSSEALQLRADWASPT